MISDHVESKKWHAFSGDKVDKYEQADGEVCRINQELEAIAGWGLGDVGRGAGVEKLQGSEDRRALPTARDPGDLLADEAGGCDTESELM
jgi:hypothetical protein